MSAFFILFFLYCFMLPLISYRIIKWRIKIIKWIRTIINTRNSTYRIHEALDSWMGIDEGAIMSILKNNEIDKRGLIWNYFKFYNKNLKDQLQNELTEKDFNNILYYLNS